MRTAILSILVLFLCAVTTRGAPPKPRPATGKGMLVMRTSAAGGEVVLYREPGVGRVAEKPPAKLPLLTHVVESADGDYPTAVLGKRGAWLRIAYDEAEREGWIEMERPWRYTSWEEFLPGHTVRLLPGLKKGYALLRREPVPSAAGLAPLSPELTLKVELVQGDWLRVCFDPKTSGWLRWRDENGRFLVSLPADNGQQKR